MTVTITCLEGPSGIGGLIVIPCRVAAGAVCMSHPEDLGQRFKKTRTHSNQAMTRPDPSGRTGCLARLRQEGG